MASGTLPITDRAYGAIAGLWQAPRTHRFISTALAALFIVSLLAFEAGRRGLCSTRRTRGLRRG